jgi:hypothetical protein
MRIYEDTVLAIKELTSTKTGSGTVQETQLDLRSGTIFGKSKKLSGGSKYEITLPNGVAGIRGTVYMINAQGLLDVLEGAVVIAYVAPDGSVITKTVNAGYEFDPRTGQLTPISVIKELQMMRAAREAGYGPNSQPTTYRTDDTTITVSPVAGNPGSSSGETPGK